MAVSRKIDQDTSEMVQKGVGYKASYYVDNGVSSGINLGLLVAVKGDGASAAEIGKTLTTLQLADASDKKKASGIMATSSPKDQYGRKDDIAIDEIMFPYGDRENRKAGLVKEAVLIYNDVDVADYRKFRTVTESLTGTHTIAGTTALVGVGSAYTTELNEGDFVLVAGEERQVVTITDDNNAVVSVAFTGSSAGNTATVLTQIEKPCWLAEDGTTTIIEPVTSGLFKQQTGYVVASNMEQVNLYIDPNGSIIA